MGLSNSRPYTLAAEEATAVTDPGLIGVGTRAMRMGRLVLRLTNTMSRLV